MAKKVKGAKRAEMARRANEAKEAKKALRLSIAKRRAIRRQAEVEVEIEDKVLRNRVILGVMLLMILGIWVIFASVLQAELARRPFLAATFGFVYNEATALTAIGLFLIIFLDTLFFVIFPGELYFFVALSHGMNPGVAIAAAATGGILGQICNYWMGCYARKKGENRPRGAKLLALADRANGRGGTLFLAVALATPSPEIIGFAYGLGKFPADKFAKMVAAFRTVKWCLLFLAFIYLRNYLAIFGI